MFVLCERGNVNLASKIKQIYGYTCENVCYINMFKIMLKDCDTQL